MSALLSVITRSSINWVPKNGWILLFDPGLHASSMKEAYCKPVQLFEQGLRIHRKENSASLLSQVIESARVPQRGELFSKKTDICAAYRLPNPAKMAKNNENSVRMAKNDNITTFQKRPKWPKIIKIPPPESGQNS